MDENGIESRKPLETDSHPGGDALGLGRGPGPAHPAFCVHERKIRKSDEKVHGRADHLRRLGGYEDTLLGEVLGETDERAITELDAGHEPRFAPRRSAFLGMRPLCEIGLAFRGERRPRCWPEIVSRIEPANQLLAQHGSGSSLGLVAFPRLFR